MSRTKFEDKLFIDALNYYVDHLQIELQNQRADFLRHILDPLCALANEFIVKCRCKKRYEGNHKKYKLGGFITDAAQSNPSGEITLEHVVPLFIVEQTLLNEGEFFCKSKQRKKLLARVRELIIPCIVTKGEDGRLNSLNKNSMPSSSKPGYYWARYDALNIKASNPNIPPPLQKECNDIINLVGDDLKLV